MIPKKTVMIMIPFIVVALLCSLLGSAWFGRPGAYESANEVLEQSAREVTAMATVAGGASAVLTVLDQDPVAEEFAELFEYFILILTVLYFEKFLMPLFGVVSFKWIIPICFILMGITYVRKSVRFRNLIAKIALAAFILYLIIPTSISCMKYVRTNFGDMFDSTVGAVVETEIVNDLEEIVDSEMPETVEEVEIAAEEVTEEVSQPEIEQPEVTEQVEPEEEGNIFSRAWGSVAGFASNVADDGKDMLNDALNDAKDLFSEAKESVTQTITKISDNLSVLGPKVKNYGENLLKQITTAIAIMLISSCLIPLATLLIFTVVLKVLFGFDFFVEKDNAKDKLGKMLENAKTDNFKLMKKLEEKGIISADENE